MSPLFYFKIYVDNWYLIKIEQFLPTFIIKQNHTIIIKQNHTLFNLFPTGKTIFSQIFINLQEGNYSFNNDKI